MNGMDYNHITSFLDKFKKIIFQKEENKELVVGVISKEISFEIKKDSVKIKNGIIYIKESPIVRNEIMMRKKQILNKLKNVLPENLFLDIK